VFCVGLLELFPCGGHSEGRGGIVRPFSPFFSLAPLVLCYSSCAGLQVVEVAQNFCEHLFVAMVFHPAGLIPVSSHLTYQYFFVPIFLHRFLVEGCPWLCGPWVPYPIRFLDEFNPGFSLALGVEFSLPLVYDHFSLWIDLHNKGAFGLSVCLLHPCDLLDACWNFLPLGAPLPMCIIHSYHLGLNAMAYVLTLSFTSILPLLVSLIVAH
jgi:hypothetical protein